MFDELREWRKANREYKAFTKKWDRLDREKSLAGEPINFLENEEYGIELRLARKRQQIAETSLLKKKASRLGIDIYHELPVDAKDSLGQPVWWEKLEGETWHTLNYSGAARLRSLIKDKQYELAKKWTDLLAPMFSTVISILALIIAILALYLQAVSDPIIVLPPR